MKLAKKNKHSPCLPLFAWVIWPCKDITQHEIISEAICQFTLKRIFWLATPYGPICKSFNETGVISNPLYRPRGWNHSPDWADRESQGGFCEGIRKETK